MLRRVVRRDLKSLTTKYTTSTTLASHCVPWHRPPHRPRSTAEWEGSRGVHLPRTQVLGVQVSGTKESEWFKILDEKVRRR